MANNGIYYSSGHSLSFTTTGTTWATLTSGGTFLINTVSGGTYLNLPQSVSGTGLVNYIAKWTGTTGLGTSLIYDTGTFVGVGKTSPSILNSQFGVSSAMEIDNVQFTVKGNSIGITDGDLTSWQTNGNEIAIGNGNPLAGSQGTDNIAIGYGTLQTNSTGLYNVAIGTNSLLSNENGQENIAIGHNAGNNITSGSQNIAIGLESLNQTDVGLDNIAIGAQAGYSNVFGNNNTIIGALANQVGSGDTSVFLGYSAGLNATSNSSVFLGPNAGYNESSNQRLHIANTNLKTLIYGEFDNDLVKIGGTLSATTYQNLPGSSSANCFTDFFVTNISGCSPVNMLSPLNVQDGLSVTGTSTFTSQANFTGGLLANTFSATTYQNLPVSAATNGTGISTSTSNGVVTITNTDLGSSQNIFKNIQAGGVTQFSAGSNSSDLNFSGINITITSAATNTLVFSAGTAGAGSVSSVTAGTGLSGNSTTGAVTLQLSNPSYTIYANNTALTAVPTATTYKETGEADFSATSTITWGTPPSPAGNYRYRWQQIGNMVVFNFEWTSTGIGTLPLTITLPTDMPSPAIPTGFNVANYITHRYFCVFNNNVGGTGTTTTASNMALRRNSSNNGWEFNNPLTNLVRWFNFNGNYFV